MFVVAEVAKHIKLCLADAGLCHVLAHSPSGQQSGCVPFIKPLVCGGQHVCFWVVLVGYMVPAYWATGMCMDQSSPAEHRLLHRTYGIACTHFRMRSRSLCC